jgi:hypothetical protein
MGLQGDLDNKSPFSTRVFRLLLKSLSNDLFVFFLDFLFADNAALSRIFTISEVGISGSSTLSSRFFSKNSFTDFLYIG